MKTLGIVAEKQNNCHCSERCSVTADMTSNQTISEPLLQSQVSKKTKSGKKSLIVKNLAAYSQQLSNLSLYAAIFLFAAGLLVPLPPLLDSLLFVASYVLSGAQILFLMLKNIIKGDIFDENFLMSIATIGALAIGEYPEAAAVMIFYRIGLYFQEMAIKRARRSISSLMDIRPDYANLKAGSDILKVSPEDVKVGDRIIIRPGERIPLDGTVLEGHSALDTSALTGEALPINVSPGSAVLSGSVNAYGLLTLEVSKPYRESAVSKILDLVQNAVLKKSRTENFITRFAKLYTPIVVFAAAALAIFPPLLLPEASFETWFHRALIFLVASCPCALVISIPLSFFGGIGGASRNGILIRGANYLEALSSVNTVVFDKTGTLTKGQFTITNIEPAKGFDKDNLLYFAALAESGSNHPIAQSIVKAYGKEINFNNIRNYEEIAGKGVKATIKGVKATIVGTDVFVGNASMIDFDGINLPDYEINGTPIHVMIGGSYAGYLVASDELKPDSKKAISELRKMGIKHIAMLTGDRKSTSQMISATLGIDEFHSELLPHQKVELIESYIENGKAHKGKLAFAGDGINDAPSLARSDIGIAMGGIGSDAAIEAADVVLMTDEPSKIATAIRIAKKTRKIVWQNIILALGTEILVLTLSAFGYATMWMAVFSDSGVVVLAVLNAMRAMRIERWQES